jgi:hypothetical protein
MVNTFYWTTRDGQWPGSELWLTHTGSLQRRREKPTRWSWGVMRGRGGWFSPPGPGPGELKQVTEDRVSFLDRCWLEIRFIFKLLANLTRLHIATGKCRIIETHPWTVTVVFVKMQSYWEIFDIRGRKPHLSHTGNLNPNVWKICKWMQINYIHRNIDVYKVEWIELVNILNFYIN